MTETRPVLRCANVRKTFDRGKTGKLSVLDGISLTVGAGEIVGVFGPNGCGKTTLVRICAGLVAPEEGKAEIDGQDPARASIGYVPQNYRESLFPWLTNLENIAFPLRLKGVDRLEREKEVRELVSRFGLDVPLDRYPYASSGGEQQKVALLRPVVARPRVILADECLAALDFESRIEMQDRFLSLLRDTGIATLLVSHDPEEAAYMSDRVIVLSQKPTRIVAELRVNLPRQRDQSMKLGSELLSARRSIVDALSGAAQR
jgi:NitT/TauT family transport system ATP-binding protein